MTTLTSGCTEELDYGRLVREGTSQDERAAPALSPGFAPVDGRKMADDMVFAAAYSSHLKFYNASDSHDGDWRRFFSRDSSYLLAVTSVDRVHQYQAAVRSAFDVIQGKVPGATDDERKAGLGSVFANVGSLARQLDLLYQALPLDSPLRATIRNLVRAQLARHFRRLIAYFLGSPPPLSLADIAAPKGKILGSPIATFGSVLGAGLSEDWRSPEGVSWADFLASVQPAPEAYGPGPTIAEFTRHIANYSPFTSVFDLFLRTYARVVADAGRALEASFSANGHEPHYGLFLAFLRLFDHARSETNKLTGLHLDFYYRDVLRLKERPAEAARAHLLVELAKQAPALELSAGTAFRAGKDDAAKEAFYASERALIANRAKVVELKSVYRHRNASVSERLPFQDGRLFASPVSNSDDGAGAKLSAEDKSWHPFFNKLYRDGALTEIRMPQAQIGFAIASHYLWMAEGTRTVTLEFSMAKMPASGDLSAHVTCLLTSEKGWIEKRPSAFAAVAGSAGKLRLTLSLDGADPAVTPYDQKTHGYAFPTNLPLLLVVLRHRPDAEYGYTALEGAEVLGMSLKVHVEGLKSVALANDLGSIDGSKPFQPFGALPVDGSSFTVGSREIFQKKITRLALEITWLVKAIAYPGAESKVADRLRAGREAEDAPVLAIRSTRQEEDVRASDHGVVGEFNRAESEQERPPILGVDVLTAGTWESTNVTAAITSEKIDLTSAVSSLDPGELNLAPDEPFSSSLRSGFFRLQVIGDFGREKYQAALIAKILADKTSLSGAPVAPSIGAFSLSYDAELDIPLDSAKEAGYSTRDARFYHLAPFGHAEQHPWLTGGTNVTLVPRFSVDGQPAVGELYIGVQDLAPAQTLAVLFQVVDGTANPLVVKPPSHVHWSYLRHNAWLPLADEFVNDGTNGLVESGIVTIAVPADASSDSTLLPPGNHWLRLAVQAQPDAVCRLLTVAPQALEVRFVDRGNDPSFSSRALPAGTITRLEQPNASVKSISQPFGAFGGRGTESPSEFYTRASERLRHKDRALSLWDYERLVLEAFPAIYRVRCLNHTQYEPGEDGGGVYRELAPGHLTIVTIPKQLAANERDPLRPFTSTGLLREIEEFLRKRISCFAHLHVRNPQFEEVQTDFRVRFRPGVDEAYHISKLKEEITAFLSPWAFPGGRRPTFGGKIHRSALVNFVEERPYVDYVTDFKLFHRSLAADSSSHQLGAVARDLAELEPSLAIAILASVPAGRHVINSIDAREEEVARSCDPCETVNE